MCVNHLKRCKTSNLAGGMRPSCKRMPTKLCMMMEAGADHPGVPALPFQCFQQWDVANPRTTMPFPHKFFSFLACTVLQSEFLPTLSDGTVASSKDVERIPLHCLSRLVRPSHSLFPVRFNWSVFCTSDFHIRNSIRYFCKTYQDV